MCILSTVGVDDHRALLFGKNGQLAFIFQERRKWDFLRNRKLVSENGRTVLCHCEELAVYFHEQRK